VYVSVCSCRRWLVSSVVPNGIQFSSLHRLLQCNVSSMLVLAVVWLLLTSFLATIGRSVNSFFTRSLLLFRIQDVHGTCLLCTWPALYFQLLYNSCTVRLIVTKVFGTHPLTFVCNKLGIMCE